jgi:hypothetical protein
MAYQPFHEIFPDVADKETRRIIVYNDAELPGGEYYLIEAYCNEPQCDCRRVFFSVYSLQRQEVVAVIAYGWESPEYYAEWYGMNGPEIIRDLKGPVLNSASPQSELAPALLERIEWVLDDQDYVARIKRHYRMFKATIDDADPQMPPPVARKVGRNDPCPCGSGLKYKRCCGK